MQDEGTGTLTWHSNLYTPLLTAILKPFFKTPAQGAATSIYLATQAIDTSGGYYVNSKLARAKPWASDAAQAERLWQVSVKACGLDEK